MDNKKPLRSMESLKKAARFIAEHKDDFTRAIQARQAMLTAVGEMYADYKKKVLYEEALDYASK